MSTCAVCAKPAAREVRGTPICSAACLTAHGYTAGVKANIDPGVTEKRAEIAINGVIDYSEDSRRLEKYLSLIHI